jgi:hypothetical protein
MAAGRGVGLLLVAVLAACGSPAPPSAPPAPPDQVDRSQIIRLSELAKASLLEEADLPFTVQKHLLEINRVGYRLQHACEASLPTDARIVTTDADWWIATGSDASVDQLAVAYDGPLAAQALREAAAALTCGSYELLDHSYSDRTTLELTGNGVGFCERVSGERKVFDDAHLCTVITGHDQVACSVRAWAHDLATAEDYARKVWPAVVRHCG